MNTRENRPGIMNIPSENIPLQPPTENATEVKVLIPEYNDHHEHQVSHKKASGKSSAR